MYASCLFCYGDLGRNPLLLTFPIGRRLAFDPARGRLWVICPACHRWNLTPLDERWEAIEDAERWFRGTRLRYSTGQVGLARFPCGTALVRIGPALTPEVAAWRYGRHLMRWLPGRALRAAARDAVDLADRGLRRLGLRAPYDLATWVRLRRRPGRVVAVAPLPDGPSAIRRSHLGAARLVRPDPREPWQLVVAHDRGAATLQGDQAVQVAGKLLAAVNGTGAPEDQVRYAVAKLDDAANPDGYFARVAAIALRCWWGRRPDAPRDADTTSRADTPAERLALHLTKRSFWGRGGLGSEASTALPGLPLVDRLALEMAANEDAERRALEGELRVLEHAWRHAEQIAAIADDLLFHAATPG